MSATRVEASGRGIPTIGTDMAFPCEGPNVPAYGLTKREYIATAALQGILAHSYNDATYEGAARDAVAHADELLRALSDEQGVSK